MLFFSHVGGDFLQCVNVIQVEGDLEYCVGVFPRKEVTMGSVLMFVQVGSDLEQCVDVAKEGGDFGQCVDVVQVREDLGQCVDVCQGRRRP